MEAQAKLCRETQIRRRRPIRTQVRTQAGRVLEVRQTWRFWCKTQRAKARSNTARWTALGRQAQLGAAKDLCTQLAKFKLLILTDDCGRKDPHDHGE